ncbi:GNAT family N-acetyltransferase [Amycolatopsis sp. MtRt-6]|uniref:GNAT family N-acetyltransferase n=1 Tax=Amycolatopsis sp. MtRt-6 TaxID=2792782 RepID=UPI001A90214C|nr:GNAT family N-acetyltransferase [Amycolatopsis sp. MtRt-6]
MRGYRLRAATEADIPALLAILDGASEWLGSQGTDQWAGSRWRAEELRPDLATGGLRVAEQLRPDLATGVSAAAEPALAEAGRSSPPLRAVPVATMTLGETASSLHLGHFAVDRRFAGLGVGAWLIREAADEAARRGKRSLRLDAWTTNTRLHDYYRRQGFRLVRISGGTSGALFERAVSPR